MDNVGDTLGTEPEGAFVGTLVGTIVVVGPSVGERVGFGMAGE